MATSTDLRSAIEDVHENLPQNQLSPEGELLPMEGDWSTRLERRVGALPWWVISAATHTVLFLLIMLLASAVAPPATDEVIISTDILKPKPPEYDPMKKRDIFKNPKEVPAETQVENPVVTHEKVEEDHFETDNSMDKNTARGNEEAISDIPLGGTGTIGSIGVGGGGMAGVFGYRDGGGRKKAVGRFGGSQATESAVEAALRWLARHQEADGHWDCKKYVEGADKRPLGTEQDVGVTGLALLAFLGAGYTEKSGQFADTVKRAEDWLMKQQHTDPEKDKKILGALYVTQSGPWQVTEAGAYDHAIASLALAEAYGMGKDPKIGDAAQLAVDYSIKIHQAPYSGWRYRPKEKADVSLTGWFVMQLKSAKIAGLKVDGAGFQGASTFLDTVTEKTGGKEGMVHYVAGNKESTSMTAVGMVSRLFMGAPNSDQMLVKGSEWLAKDLPDWKNAVANDKYVHGASHDESFYYWYYGTLAMFQMGGDGWKKWNDALKPTLVDNQCRGPVPLSGAITDKDGSWDPVAHVDKTGGRVYTTALGALTLEVYYRYLPMYAK